jgi:hypothetical protein
VSSLFQDVKISEATLNKAFEHQAVLSINQLEKIADYFNQSLLFFVEKTEATAENIYSPAFRTINNQQPIESRKQCANSCIKVNAIAPLLCFLMAIIGSMS